MRNDWGDEDDNNNKKPKADKEDSMIQSIEHTKSK